MFGWVRGERKQAKISDYTCSFPPKNLITPALSGVNFVGLFNHTNIFIKGRLKRGNYFGDRELLLCCCSDSPYGPLAITKRSTVKSCYVARYSINGNKEATTHKGTLFCPLYNKNLGSTFYPEGFLRSWYHSILLKLALSEPKSAEENVLDVTVNKTINS